MAWVDADEELVGGGTEFPMLRARGGGENVCQFIECDGEGQESEEEKGTVFKVKPGNAV